MQSLCSPLTTSEVFLVSGRAQALRFTIVTETPEGSRPTAKKCFKALPGACRIKSRPSLGSTKFRAVLPGGGTALTSADSLG
ncbi:hypothetical protein TBK1r_14210 [Stieleria magnilauensis]|uniref:Uncharacterized protein n=1 Tax=Stieleria magnilauensis TaxID=2527963 RepID=A0ABX5XM89_9BACT|nr:hypothetical protein TBK1r_14210 [Planctomycetes bacterium TBK1r]